MRFWGCLSGDAGEGWKIDWNVLVQITLKLHRGRQRKIERDAVDVCASSSSSSSSNGEHKVDDEDNAHRAHEEEE